MFKRAKRAKRVKRAGRFTSDASAVAATRTMLGASTGTPSPL
jgi:hypothetical protein